MPKLRHIFLLVTLISTVALFPISASSQKAAPAAVVRAFYKFNRSHLRLVTHQSIYARKRWLSPPLYQTFLRSAKLEKEYLKKNPTDKGYWGDGFPFQPYEETCTAVGKVYYWAYHVGTPVIRRNKAEVPVSFFYPDVCNLSPTIYKLKLSNNKGSWQIDDLLYEDGSSLFTDIKQHSY